MIFLTDRNYILVVHFLLKRRLLGHRYLFRLTIIKDLQVSDTAVNFLVNFVPAETRSQASRIFSHLWRFLILYSFYDLLNIIAVAKSKYWHRIVLHERDRNVCRWFTPYIGIGELDLTAFSDHSASR